MSAAKAEGLPLQDGRRVLPRARTDHGAFGVLPAGLAARALHSCTHVDTERTGVQVSHTQRERQTASRSRSAALHAAAQHQHQSQPQAWALAIIIHTWCFTRMWLAL